MRRESLLFLLLAALAATGSPDGEDDRQGRDSYLEAYEDSHGSGPPSEVVFPSPEHESPSYYTPSSPPPYKAPAPAHSYGPPVSSSYGPPVSSSYGPPVSSSYGPPVSPSYGPPPSPSYPMYGPPPSSVYGAPHSAPNNGFNLLGLDIHTILKILLKITIFKLIVKFITILCLLLFIPKFDMGSTSSTPAEEERGRYGVVRDKFIVNFDRSAHIQMDAHVIDLASGGSEESINALTHLVLNAIENNSTLDTGTGPSGDCQDKLYCSLARAAKIVDSRTSFTGPLQNQPSDISANGSTTIQDFAQHTTGMDSGTRTVVQLNPVWFDPCLATQISPTHDSGTRTVVQLNPV
uniref:(California timema) hypothetical protein n=1 Tax=Timema californicum TaxID=61474 RepID=A0A7R9PDV0_TIMCA|nr:unnamed protein product [Timema californicum]